MPLLLASAQAAPEFVGCVVVCSYQECPIEAASARADSSTPFRSQHRYQLQENEDEKVFTKS